jgi:hypothetical protein
VFEPAELIIRWQLFSCSKVAVMLVTALIKLDAMNTLSSVVAEVVDVGVVVGETVAVGVTSGVAVGVGSGFAENVPLYAK